MPHQNEESYENVGVPKKYDVVKKQDRTLRLQFILQQE